MRNEKRAPLGEWEADEREAERARIAGLIRAAKRNQAEAKSAASTLGKRWQPQARAAEQWWKGEAHRLSMASLRLAPDPDTRPPSERIAEIQAKMAEWQRNEGASVSEPQPPTEPPKPQSLPRMPRNAPVKPKASEDAPSPKIVRKRPTRAHRGSESGQAPANATPDRANDFCIPTNSGDGGFCIPQFETEAELNEWRAKQGLPRI